jgi:hypothetical protein
LGSVARLFRVIRRNPPTARDFESPLAKGRKPPGPEQEEGYRAVSTFITLELARHKAIDLRLGDFVAELEVPAAVEQHPDAEGHVDLENTTPEQLLGYVVQVHRAQG